MSKRFSIGTVIVLLVLAIVLTFQITFVAVSKKYTAALNELSVNLGAYSKLAEVDAIYRSYYIGEIDEDTLSDMIIHGYVAGTGDRYAYYMNREQFAESMSDLSADMVGVGVIVIYSELGIEVISVMPDSPALEAGVLPGDIIVKVEGELVSELGYAGAVNKVLGEEGTDASFTVLRGGEMIDFTVTRAHITEISVMSRVYELDETVGVIRILEFDLATPLQLKEAYDRLTAAGVSRIVFDVRYNSGGELESVCSILDLLLPEGPIIHIEDAEGNRETINSDEFFYDLPMAVLVNESTASAAELFACALKDYDRAELIGTTTFGKGTMQRILPLSDGSGLAVSYRMYLPPYSDCYEGVGVEPDYICELDEALLSKNIYKITDAEDNQLARAVEVLNGVNLAE